MSWVNNGRREQNGKTEGRKRRRGGRQLHGRIKRSPEGRPKGRKDDQREALTVGADLNSHKFYRNYPRVCAVLFFEVTGSSLRSLCLQIKKNTQTTYSPNLIYLHFSLCSTDVVDVFKKVPYSTHVFFRELIFHLKLQIIQNAL